MDSRRDDDARNNKPVRIPSLPPPRRSRTMKAAKENKPRSGSADRPADRG